jgi:hypothetical protein
MATLPLRRHFRRARRRLGKWLLNAGGPYVFGLLARTWRVELVGGEHIDAVSARGGYLILLWHGRMLLGIEFFRGRAYHVLVSPSADGELSQILLEHFGFPVILGSTSRGGAHAVRRMREVLDARGTVVITPDGPRGPRHSFNPGTPWLARATGAPVLALGLATDRAWRLDSWDRFTIPKPRARVVISVSEPLEVPRDASDSDLQRASETLRRCLLDAERAAFERLGVEPDW